MTTIANPTTTVRVGDIEVSRLGFGSMRLTGAGNWGYPEDPDGARAVIRRAVELGVQFIDTSDAYGPLVAEELIASALYPYPADILVATKAGLTRHGPNLYGQVGHPDYLRQCVELSLRRLRRETIDLFQLHRLDPNFPIADQVGVLVDAREAGKIRNIGLSEVTVAQLDEAQQTAPIASVQNLYNITDRKGWFGESEEILRRCEADGLAFIPWAPLDRSKLATPAGGRLVAIAEQVGATPSQLALAWLLHWSPVTLPIPGTSSIVHLEENLAAREVVLTPELVHEISAIGLEMGPQFEAGPPAASDVR